MSNTTTLMLSHTIFDTNCILPQCPRAPYREASHPSRPAEPTAGPEWRGETCGCPTVIWIPMARPSKESVKPMVMLVVGVHAEPYGESPRIIGGDFRSMFHHHKPCGAHFGARKQYPGSVSKGICGHSCWKPTARPRIQAI
jgi:hypothetical protein